jgi:hypothetical protein
MIEVVACTTGLSGVMALVGTILSFKHAPVPSMYINRKVHELYQEMSVSDPKLEVMFGNFGHWYMYVESIKWISRGTPCESLGSVIDDSSKPYGISHENVRLYRDATSHPWNPHNGAQLVVFRPKSREENWIDVAESDLQALDLQLEVKYRSISFFPLKTVLLNLTL